MEFKKHIKHKNINKYKILPVLLIINLNSLLRIFIPLILMINIIYIFNFKNNNTKSFLNIKIFYNKTLQ